jgi:hypothetical protein
LHAEEIYFKMSKPSPDQTIKKRIQQYPDPGSTEFPYLNSLGGGNVPDPDGGVVAAGDDGVLCGVVHHAVHL